MTSHAPAPDRLSPPAPDAALGSLRGRLERLGHRLGQQPHLGAVRDGVIGSLPLILLGSGFLLLAQPPWPALSRFLPNSAALVAGYRACAGTVSLYACVATALSLAARRKVDPAASAVTALGVFLVLLHTQRLAGPGYGLSLADLGAAGLFPSFLAAIFAVEVLAAFARRSWGIKLGGGAPPAVVRSFAALLPATVCITATWVIVHWLGVDLAGLLSRAAAHLVSASDAWAALALVVLIDSSLFLIGVHGLSVLAVIRPFWLKALADNMAAAMAGQPPTHLATQEFFIWFVWQGGSGATLALALLLLRARSQQLRIVGRAGFLPAIFNINEPLVFGAPVVMNATLAPPFLLAPLVLVTTSWAAMRAGFVRPPTAEVVWTLPAPVGAWLSTGGQLHALVLQLVNLGLALAIWWPFVRRYDRRLLQAEVAAAQKTAEPPTGTGR